MDLKLLKKLADTCRKAGIKHYKDKDFEFTLTEDAPVSTYKKKLSNHSPILTQSDQLIPSDSLSEEELLMWSAGGVEVSSENNTN
jgi:hypothetical protein